MSEGEGSTRQRNAGMKGGLFDFITKAQGFNALSRVEAS